MRIFREQEALHGFATSRIQLQENASKFRVDALFGGAAFSGLFVPVMAFFKVAQFHIHSTKQRARAIVLRHQGMRRLAHLNCFAPTFEVSHRPTASGEYGGFDFRLFEAIFWNAVDQF